MWHMDCKVVATIDPSNKVVSPIVAGVGLVSTWFNLVDIKVELVAERIDLVAPKVSPTAAKAIEQFLGKFLVGTDKFQLGFDHMNWK